MPPLEPLELGDVLKRLRDDPEFLLRSLDHEYRLYRESRINQKYYAHRLVVYSRYNFAYEVALAIGGSGAIATWAIWKSGTWHSVWAVIIGFVAVLAALKPLLQLGKQIERYSQRHAEWNTHYLELKDLVEAIQTARTIDSEMLNSFEAARARQKKIRTADDPGISKRLMNRFTAEAEAEIAEENLWRPNVGITALHG
jgi:hypothetical protein